MGTMLEELDKYEISNQKQIYWTHRSVIWPPTAT
jgi:hypothetical protein